MGCGIGFHEDRFYSLLLNGKLREAMDYLSRFPERSALYGRYLRRFEKNERPIYAADTRLDGLLAVYQTYYRDVFYLELSAEEALKRMRFRFGVLLGAGVRGVDFDALEEGPVAAAFRDSSFQFLGGRTDGFYGPYIWRTTEETAYEVELPGGIQPFPIRFLDGFLSKSWLDYLSFGAVGTGGWTDGDGVICCVRSAYDVDSEDFRVSLLKHEAQHATDLETYPGIAPADLEYRAKLVELIYSKERNLLPVFLREAGGPGGHSAAADRIATDFSRELNCDCGRLTELSPGGIRPVAGDLFARSENEVRRKYLRP